MNSYIKLFLYCFAALVFLSGCCDRTKCGPESNAAAFYGFTAADMDSAIISIYTKNSGFSGSIDSFGLNPFFEASDSSYVIWFSGTNTINSPADVDVQIYLPASNLTYRIHNTQYKSELCYKCGTKKSYENRLVSYKVNNIPKTVEYGSWPEFRINK